MKSVLVKVKDKKTLLSLKQYGNVYAISPIFSIYGMRLTNENVDIIRSNPGVISVEDDDKFSVQSK